MATSTFAEAIDLLRARRFGIFWFASLLSNIGTWAQQVAQPWLLLTLGASPFLVGLDSFAMNAPVWFLTLAGGVLADRADRRRVIAGFQSIQMICPILIVALLVAGAIQPRMIIGLSLIVGITDALSMPSFQSIVPSIVQHDQIPAALALNATQFNLSRILGPVLAGVIMASVGAVGCFALNAASYIPFIMVAFWILPRRREPQDDRAPDRHELVKGLRFILNSTNLRRTLGTVLSTSLLCSPLITFCPVLVKEDFGGDASELSLALGGFGLGGLLGSIGLLSVDPSRDRGALSAWFAAGYGAILLMGALNPWFPLLPIIMVLAGGAMVVTTTSANSVLQTSAPMHLLGQVVALQMLAIRGGVSLGSLVAGFSVSVFGVRQALLVNGLCAIAIQLSLGGLKSLRRRQSLE